VAYNILTNSLGTQTQTDIGKREILIDSADDLASIPADTAPGSVAYTADMLTMYMKANDGAWKRIGGGT